MAKYGARYSRWAPWAADFDDTDATKIPKYGTVVNIGQLNKASENLNFNEGSLPGDDQIVLYEKAFKDGTVDVESVYLAVKDAAAILGASCDEENGLAHGDDDKAPYGGYGAITHHVSKTKSYFQAVSTPRSRLPSRARPTRPVATTSTLPPISCPFMWNPRPAGSTKSSRTLTARMLQSLTSTVCLPVRPRYPAFRRLRKAHNRPA